MISSTIRAPRYGQGRAGGKLIVDGRDEVVFRKAEIAFKPLTRAQKRSLLKLLDATRETFNAALQERRDAYQHPSRTKIDMFQQFGHITGLRGVRDDVLVWGIQPLRWSMRRVDEAFSAFFRRVSTGETPGYPRFKGKGRWRTIGYDETTGWKLNLGGTKKHPRPHLYVQGVGVIPLSNPAVRQLRQYAERGGVPTTLTLTRANKEGSAWRASIGFGDLAVEQLPVAQPGSTAGIDRGVAVLVALASGATAAEAMRAPETSGIMHHADDLVSRLSSIRAAIIALQQDRSGKKKYGRRWRQLSRRIARLHRRASNIEENWARHTAKHLVTEHEVIVLEDLNLQAMMRSAKGTIEEPGKNVAAKSGLNRALAQAAPARVARWVAVKAESAGLGRRIWLVNPANTSQQCSACGVIDATNRITRETFYCGSCGHYEHADINAARNIRARGLAAERAWNEAGRPGLVRPKPRLRRRKRPPPETAS
ncbi:transposase [Kineosporia sp. NBRC 101731]|uniref:RNA-guided endonuclease InsQ/TnpB family protein n=1 Tax=Kineosporia sp. NBRC 101731 TaxID=3032199 RepID=UPI002554EF48|nr:transposase [Kineosporia sp. NBRC 101731]